MCSAQPGVQQQLNRLVLLYTATTSLLLLVLGPGQVGGLPAEAGSFNGDDGDNVGEFGGGGRDVARVVSGGNCFSLLDENELGSVVGHNATTASITLCTSPLCTTASSVREEEEVRRDTVEACLRGQTSDVSLSYRVTVKGDSLSAKYIHPVLHTWAGSASQLVESPPAFPYIVYGGRYRLGISVCHTSLPFTAAKSERRRRREEGGGGSTLTAAMTCTEDLHTGYISLQSEMYTWCQDEIRRDNINNNNTVVSASSPTVSGGAATFQFSYQPCTLVQPYDTANITLYELEREEEECGGEGQVEVLREGEVQVTGNLDGSTNITYTSPSVQGDKYYCVIADLNHISCLLPSVNPPEFCRLTSRPVWIRSEPLLAQILPFCRSHFACGWVYIVIGGSAILLVSLCLAVVCVRCCDRKGRKKQSFIHDEVDFAGGEVINLTSTLPERRTWQEVHQEWHEAGGDRTRGKILLLYSPDTKLFKELQEALKSFLEMACHCDIYDLFDDALFDTIALDPADWLEKFTKDSDVKIIIISSIGAYRRQMALQLKMPLNLPENSLLDGLFTSGLKFVSSHPELASSGRVATARYEMLHLTEEGHRLGPPVGGGANNEFLIPTQLHELFCWVHQLQPLDLMGKPWANYHLELQLLQDALKLVRRDRTLMTTVNGNGMTQI